MLRRNSNALPWNWFVPDLETKLMVPPEAWPDSALKPLASTLNSVRASTDGENLAAASPCVGAVLTAGHGRAVERNAKGIVAAADVVSTAALLTSGVASAMSKGLREAPFTRTGNEFTRYADTVVDTLGVLRLHHLRGGAHFDV